MEKNYRIIIETQKSGKKWYYAQKQIFGLFWVYFRECRDITMYRYRMAFISVEDAEWIIRQDIENQYRKRQQKIVNREILITDVCRKP